jgi:hypothetical protein
MKPRHIALGAALLVAAGFAIFGDKSPGGAVVEPAPRSTASPAAAAVKPVVPARASSTASKPAAPEVAILRLEPRATLISDGSDTLGQGATAFGTQNWTPPPPPPPAPPPPPPPTAPALPFTYIGKAVSKGEWEVFLARGDQTLIVRDKMVIDGVYRVDAIAPPAMTLTYLPLKQVQQLNIGVRD